MIPSRNPGHGDAPRTNTIIDQRKSKQPEGSASSGAPGGGTSGEDETFSFRERLQRREGEALSRFYELYFEKVYAFVRRMVADEHQAEDLTQDVFMHLQRSFASYDPARELGPWVFTIATNKVRDFWRSRQSKSAQSALSLDAEESGPEPVSGERGPLPSLENEELRTQLEAAIAGLPEVSRATLVLRLHQGLSFEEIARMFERNETAVRKRYSRALAELRAALEKRQIGLAGGGKA